MCLNTTDGIIFFIKLQSTIRPVLLYMYMCSIMSILSQLHDQVWLHVYCLTLDIDIPVIGLLICLYKHLQTITLHPRLFNIYMFTYTKNVPDQDNYFVCSINHILSERLYFMPEIKSVGVEAIWIEMHFIAKTSLERSSLKFRHGFNFVVLIHPRK